MKKFFLLWIAIIVCGIEISAQTSSNSYVKEINASQFYASIGSFNSVGDFKYIGKKPIVIHFDACYANPSREMIPIVEYYASQYKGIVNFYRISISIAQNGEAKHLPEERGIFDNMCAWMKRMNVAKYTGALPTLIFIRSDGRSSALQGYINNQENNNKILNEIRKIAY